MSPEVLRAQVHERMAEGAALFNQREYWHAHEAWEDAWHALRDADRKEAADLVQGLVLATAGMENLVRGKRAGFGVQLAKSLLRLREHSAWAAELGLIDLDLFHDGLLIVYLAVMADRSIEDAAALPYPVPVLRCGPRG